MPENEPSPELLQSLGRLVRGLSALFWGLPSALLISVQAARTGGFTEPFGIMGPLLTNGLLLFGLWQLGGFQPQERPWRQALDRAKLLGIINLGLCPFLYWSSRMPGEPLFFAAVWVLQLSALLFLFNLNVVVERLGAMLPDQTLRGETTYFSSLNRVLLLVVLVLTASLIGLNQISAPPHWLARILATADRIGPLFRLFLFLVPLAMTMSLIWKTKEVILDSVFRGGQ